MARLLQFGAVAMAAMVLGCTYNLKPRLAPEPFDPASAPIPRRVLFLLPHDFESYVFVASHEGREFRYAFGEAIREQIISLLHERFLSTEVRSLSGGPLALQAMLEDQHSYANADYIAVPRFTNSNSYVKPFRYGTETTIEIEFVGPSRSKFITVRGTGRAEAHIYLGPELERSAREVLIQVLNALSTELDSKRGEF